MDRREINEQVNSLVDNVGPMARENQDSLGALGVARNRRKVDPN